MVKASVLNRCRLVRRTGTGFPFTSTVLLLIICWAIEAKSAVSNKTFLRQYFWPKAFV